MAVIAVKITKAGKGVTLDVDVSPEKMPEACYAEALMLGFEVLANRRMSKITKTTYPEEAERQAAALKVAQENIENLYKGDFRARGGKGKTGVPGTVMNEARRIARGVVKDVIKENGEKVSHYEASEITRMANQLIDDDPSYIEMAKQNLEARKAKKPSKSKDIFAGIRISDKLVAKAEAKKKAGKGGVLSAKQAGKVETRTKGGAALTH